jgi:hypothetical protein
LEAKNVEKVGKILLCDLVIDVLESLFLIGKIELVKSDEIGLWVFAQKNLGKGFSDGSVTNQADLFGHLDLGCEACKWCPSCEVHLTLECLCEKLHC